MEPKAPYPETFSRFAWGLGSLPPSTTVDQVAGLLDACEDLGITTVDNAENYGGYTREKLLGDALARSPGRRERLQLVTKCGCVNPTPEYPSYTMYHYDTRREHIIEAAERSLRLFRTDRLDALLLHRPDPLMDAGEVAEAFTRLAAAGKVLRFGVSNFTVRQFDLLAAFVPSPLVTNEFQFSVLYPGPLFDGTLDQCQQRGIRPLAWGPLGRGALFTGTDAAADRMRATLAEVAGELGGVGIDQVALAWLLAHPTRVVPILGSDKPGELKSAVGAANVTLARQQWYRILIAATGESLP